jgi:hypothetical protein
MVDLFSFALTLTFGGLFLFAGLTKIAGRRDFTDAVSAMVPVDPTTAAWTGIVVPLGEITVGVGLLTGLAVGEAAALGVSLLLLFSLVLLTAIQRKVAADCHCFGAIAMASSKEAALARNSVLIMVGVGVLVLGSPHQSGSVLSGLVRGPIEAVGAAALTSVILLASLVIWHAAAFATQASARRTSVTNAEGR